MRVLITGIGGFPGSHLTDLLVADGDSEVVGVLRPGGSRENIAHHGERLTLLEGDLTDEQAVRRVVAEALPERVYHLAAQASVAASWADPVGTVQANVLSQLYLLRTVMELCPQARVLVVGSADEYGRVSPDALPVHEANSLHPPTLCAQQGEPGPDGRQCSATAMACTSCACGLSTTSAAPTQSGFVVPDFSRQIARIEAGLQAPTLKVGKAGRTPRLLRCGDVVARYRLALESGEKGAVYNICLAHLSAHQALLDACCVGSVEIAVDAITTRMRPSDQPNSWAALRAELVTGCGPLVPLAQSLEDTSNTGAPGRPL